MLQTHPAHLLAALALLLGLRELLALVAHRNDVSILFAALLAPDRCEVAAALRARVYSC